MPASSHIEIEGNGNSVSINYSLNGNNRGTDDPFQSFIQGLAVGAAFGGATAVAGGVQAVAGVH